MLEVKNSIIDQKYDKLKALKLNTGPAETLLISLEKDALFPEHISPRDAQLIVLEGEIQFHINDEVFTIKKHQDFKFPERIKHWVTASQNSKFLIIR